MTKCFSGNLDYLAFAENTILTRSYDLASNMSTAEAQKFLVRQHKEAEALYQTQFDVCRKTMGEQLRYMGTSTVVRDIDYITKQLEGPDALMSARLSLILVLVPNVIVATSGDFPMALSSDNTWSTCKHAPIAGGTHILTVFMKAPRQGRQDYH